MKRSNNQLLFALLSLALSMILLTFASVPLYSLFCKATGFGGTTNRAEISVIKKYGQRYLTISFDANIDKNLPWNFKALQQNVSIRTGENILAFYQAVNLSNQPITGMAVYNVTPMKAGKYFVKVDCFCFQSQIIPAHKEMLLPVSFYIDPAFDDDPSMQDVTNITLSYSFFKID